MSIDNLINQLLFEEESTTLDFKGEQYRFGNGASEEEQSELLKDIVSFANAFRRTDAYILIGVKEVKGGQSIVVGVDEHLEDAHLQQFVNSKVQRPIAFSYRAVNYQDKQVGLIHIPIQARPFYLEKNCGKLKKREVYVRRGASTAVAAPDEIALMGRDNAVNGLVPPTLDIYLIDEVHGEVLTCESEHVQYIIKSDVSKLPDYGPRGGPLSVIDELITANERPNREYYRQFAAYLTVQNYFSGIRLAVKNNGTAAARDVKAVFEILKNESVLRMALGSDLPKVPERTVQALPVMSFGTSSYDRDFSLENTRLGWRVTCHLGKIQPKDTSSARDSVFVCVKESTTIRIEAKVYSDDLPDPKVEVFDFRIRVEKVDREPADMIAIIDDLKDNYLMPPKKR